MGRVACDATNAHVHTNGFKDIHIISSHSVIPALGAKHRSDANGLGVGTTTSGEPGRSATLSPKRMRYSFTG